jgi:hypothetical protein
VWYYCHTELEAPALNSYSQCLGTGCATKKNFTIYAESALKEESLLATNLMIKF